VRAERKSRSRATSKTDVMLPRLLLPHERLLLQLLGERPCLVLQVTRAGRLRRWVYERRPRSISIHHPCRDTLGLSVLKGRETYEYEVSCPPSRSDVHQCDVAAVWCKSTWEDSSHRNTTLPCRY